MNSFQLNVFNLLFIDCIFFYFLDLIAKSQTTIGELKKNIQQTLSRKIKLEEDGPSCLSWYIFIVSVENQEQKYNEGSELKRISR